MRLFVGSWPSEEVIELATKWRTRLNPSLGNLATWTPPDRLHATLLFIGEVGEERLVALRRELANLDAPAAEMIARPLLVMPTARRPDVVAIGFEDAAGNCESLANALAAVAGIESGRFLPHVTIARVKGRNLPQARAALPTVRSIRLNERVDWRVRSVWLVKSVLKPEGSEYERLQELRLS